MQFNISAPLRFTYLIDYCGKDRVHLTCNLSKQLRYSGLGNRRTSPSGVWTCLNGRIPWGRQTTLEGLGNPLRSSRGVQGDCTRNVRATLLLLQTRPEKAAQHIYIYFVTTLIGAQISNGLKCTVAAKAMMYLVLHNTWGPSKH